MPNQLGTVRAKYGVKNLPTEYSVLCIAAHFSSSGLECGELQPTTPGGCGEIDLWRDLRGMYARFDHFLPEDLLPHGDSVIFLIYHNAISQKM